MTSGAKGIGEDGAGLDGIFTLKEEKTWHRGTVSVDKMVSLFS